MPDEQPAGGDRTRLSLTLTSLLWVSAVVTLLFGLKFHLRPIVLLGGLNALLALLASLIVSAGRSRPRRR